MNSPATTRVVVAVAASKLYKSSSRQTAILAAIQNPVNQELVRQLSEYLDDEYKELPQEELEVETNVDDQPTPDDVEELSVPDSIESVPQPSLSKDIDTDPIEEVVTDLEPEETVEDSSDDEDSTDPSLDSTNSSISATVSLNPEFSEKSATFSDVEAVKGTLNVREDTSGVVRVKATQDELWIYYNDKINLNNVMASVIEVLYSTGFVCLEFNRLARTENAIVFQIIASSTTSKEGIDE